MRIVFGGEGIALILKRTFTGNCMFCVLRVILKAATYIETG